MLVSLYSLRTKRRWVQSLLLFEGLRHIDKTPWRGGGGEHFTCIIISDVHRIVKCGYFQSSISIQHTNLPLLCSKMSPKRVYECATHRKHYTMLNMRVQYAFVYLDMRWEFTCYMYRTQTTSLRLHRCSN